MKRCTTCGEDKPREAYHADKRSSSGLCHECKVCRNLRTRDHHRRQYALNKQAYIDASQKWKQKRKDRFSDWKATLVCSVCPENEPVCLDFHHLDPTQKEIGISKAVEKWSWDKLISEISKCVVLCSNCHRKLHAGKITLGC